MEQQQFFLMLGITKLYETHKTLENLNFSECILQEITGMIDDLTGLIEDETIKKQLLSNFLDYNKEKDAYTIKKGGACSI